VLRDECGCGASRQEQDQDGTFVLRGIAVTKSPGEHAVAPRSAPSTGWLKVSAWAVLLDRIGHGSDDAVAAFLVVLPVGRRPGRSSSSNDRPVDVVEAALFERGLVRIETLDLNHFREMSTLEGWSLVDDHDHQRLTVMEPTGCLFEGSLDESVPPGWYAVLEKQRGLALLVAVGKDTFVDSRGVREMCEAGRLMGGLIEISDRRR
jgi:hypothetical protein